MNISITYKSPVYSAEVRVVLEKVLAQPTEERLRRLKASNVRVQRELLAHPEAVKREVN